MAACLAIPGTGVAGPAFLVAYALFQLALSGFPAVVAPAIALASQVTLTGGRIGLFFAGSAVAALLSAVLILATHRVK